VLYLGEINDSQHADWCRVIETLDADNQRNRQFALFPADRSVPEHAKGYGVQVRLEAMQKALRALEIQGGFLKVAFSPDGKQVAMASQGYMSGAEPEPSLVRIWEVATGRLLKELKNSRHALLGVSYSSDGRQLTLDSSVKIEVWDFDRDRVSRSFGWGQQGGRPRELGPFALSPDGRLLAFQLLFEGSISLWDIQSGHEMRALGRPLGPCLGCQDTVPGSEAAVSAVAFSPDGRQLISGHVDGTLTLLDVATGQEIRTLSADSEGVRAIAFSPDARTVIFGTRELSLWDASTGRKIGILNDQPHSNGTIMVTGRVG
jgi:WD40 repeat protein